MEPISGSWSSSSNHINHSDDTFKSFSTPGTLNDLAEPTGNTESIEDALYPSLLLKSLNNLRNISLLTDVTLCVGQEEFKCHKAVLAASSPYFEAMFSNPYREQQDSRVVIEHTSAWTMKRVLELIYTGRVDLTISNVQELLAAGRLLEYPNLVSACARFMQRRLEVANCLGVEQLADMYDLPELKEAAMKVALENFTRVSQQSGEWCQLPLSWVIKYISSDEIDVRSEEVVFHACLRWVNSEPETRSDHLFELLNHVRMRFLSEKFIQHQLSAEKLIQECLQAATLMRNELFARSHLDPVSLSNSTDDLYNSSPLASPCRRISLSSSDDDQDDSFSSKTTPPSILQTNSKIPSNNSPCSRPRPSTVKRERIVLVGGLSSYVLNSTEVFDPDRQCWYDAASLPRAPTWFSASVLHNEIFITGGISEGHILDTMYRYNSEINQWSSCAPMLTARARHASAVVGGNLFLLGGITSQAGPEGSAIHFVKSIDRYNPKTDCWEVAGHTDQPRKESVVALVDESEKYKECNGGRVLGERTLIEVGGCTEVENNTSLSQIAIHRVRPDLSIQATSNYIQLPKPIRHSCVVTRQLGTLLYILCELSGKFSVLNLARNSLHFLAPLPQPRLHCGMTCSQDKIYVIGGFLDLRSTPSSDVYCYDSINNSWTLLHTRVPTPRALPACLSLKM